MGINDLIQDFDFGNEQHIMEIKTLRVTSSNNIKHKIIEKHILSLLKIEQSENKLDGVPTKINPADLARRMPTQLNLLVTCYSGMSLLIIEQLETPNQDILLYN